MKLERYEQPILFKGEMIRAILEGRKTQTRRIVKPQPKKNEHGWTEWCHRSVIISDQNVVHQPFEKQFPAVLQSDGLAYLCPYGKPGHRLWVREKFATHFIWDDLPPGHIDIQNHSDGFFYADGTITSPGCEDHQRGKWRSSIHMPRWASRITLEITDVRVERVQDISEEDARAEGVCCTESLGGCPNYWHSCDGEKFATARSAFFDLWQSINGPDSWDANPWVWVIEFKRITPEATQ